MPSRYTRTSNIYTAYCSKNLDVIADGSGSVLTVTIFNIGTTDIYWQLFAFSRLPVLNEVPILCTPVYGGNGVTELTETVLSSDGLVFDNGVSWAASSTADKYTPVSGNALGLTIRWT
jgi:hypothetical protein